jgi:ferredoxin
MTLASLYFSPTGTTRKVVKAFAEGFGEALIENDITLPAGRAKALKDGGADLFVFAGPVYGGRSFKLLTGIIRKLEGGGRPAVCIATYGGRHYDRALADLYEAAVEAGFQVIACGAFIGEHSFSKNIQTGRPDGEDLAFAREFGQRVREKLDVLPAMAPETVPQRPVDLDAIGMHRERLGHLTPNRPAPDGNCLHCGACAMVCPLGLIDVNDSDAIKPGCLKCNTCVKTCPVGSMQFRQEAFKEVARNCEETFGREERRPQVWFG